MANKDLYNNTHPHKKVYNNSLTPRPRPQAKPVDQSDKKTPTKDGDQ